LEHSFFFSSYQLYEIETYKVGGGHQWHNVRSKFREHRSTGSETERRKHAGSNVIPYSYFSSLIERKLKMECVIKVLHTKMAQMPTKFRKPKHHKYVFN